MCFVIASVSYHFILENVTISKGYILQSSNLFYFIHIFFKYVTFSFLSLSFLSPNLEPMEYHKKCYMCLFSIWEYVTRLVRGQKLSKEEAPPACEGQLCKNCLVDVGVFFSAISSIKNKFWSGLHEYTKLVPIC